MSEPATLPESEVREALQRVLESAAFARSKRLSALLRFLMEETLGGRGDRLKAFTIAQEVYRRDETFDPRVDSLISVQAGRLRSRLKDYYETVGRDDPVLINLPKGTYTPAFTRRQARSPGTETHRPERNKEQETRLTLWGVLTVGVLLSALLIPVVWLLFGADQAMMTDPSSKPEQARTPVSAPFVAVLPFVTVSGDPLEERLAKGLVEAVITNLAKLSELSVMAHASMLELENDSPSIKWLREQFGTSHILRGSLEQTAGTVRVGVQLIDASRNTTIWGDQLDSPVDALFDLQDELARKIASALSIEVSAEERGRFLRRHTSDPEALVLYRQGLVLLMPPNDMTRILTARRLFQRVSEMDPDFAGGYAGQGFSHSVSVLFLKTSDRAHELAQGISLSRKAIEKDQSFGMGYAALAFAQALSGEVDDGLMNARHATAVQPGDAFAQFVVGMNLVLSGRSDQALAHLAKALRLDPAEPRTPYLNVLGIAYFVEGQYDNALEMFERNDERGGPTGPHMQVFRATAHAELGQEREAREVVQEFLGSNAAFRAEAWLMKWLGPGDRLARTMGHLRRLGLPPHS